MGGSSVLSFAGPDGAAVPSLAVHWLPCSLEHNGPAKVSSYFQPLLQDGPEIDGEKTFKGSIRGRGIIGGELKLPDGYSGYVLEDRSGPRSDSPSDWAAVGGFDSLTYWNHETQPLKTDSQQRLWEWLPLAQKMHTPISPEEVAKLMSKQTSAAAKRKADAVC